MLEHNGKWYARVTEVLSPLNNFSHIDPKVLANKARIGTSVHTAIEEDIAGGFPCPDADGMGYFNSYLRWVKEVKPVFTSSEQRYFDEERMLCGQIDALVNMGYNQGLPSLVDFKTSAQESKTVWPMQAHLYNYLLKANGVAVNPCFLFVKLDKAGGLPKVFSYAWDSNTQAKCLEAVDNFWLSSTK